MGPGKPAPRVTPFNAPLFASLRDGSLKLQQCPRCGEVFYYPRVACVRCLYTGELEWVPVSGLGTVHSFAVVHRPQHPSFFSEVPIVLVAVQLDEGPMIISSMTNCTPQDVRIGMRVEVTTDSPTDVAIPRFAPCSDRPGFRTPLGETPMQHEPSSGT